MTTALISSLSWLAVGLVLGLTASAAVAVRRRPRFRLWRPPAEVETLRRLAAEHERARRQAERERERAEQTVAQLRTEIEALMATGARLDGDLADAHAVTRAQAERLERLEQALHQARSALRRSDESASVARRAHQSQVASLEALVQARDATITKLQQRVPTASAAPSASAESDDLQQISGVGRLLVDMLHEAGITTFRELASLSESDGADLARELREFHGRIHRERWIEQARQLHREKYGEELVAP
ncbi:MAG: hypothetical protein OEY23_14565 [Acidimicrobiia bacterium]|nr:hypothetical protein [Acidimicrobiia bacterium]